MADFAWRPDMAINPDGHGRGAPADEEPWENYSLAEWAVMLDGLPEEEWEQYRPLMQPKYRPIFFPDLKV